MEGFVVLNYVEFHKLGDQCFYGLLHSVII